MTVKIVITTRLPNDPVGLIRAHPVGRDAEVVYLDEARIADRETLIKSVKGAHGILSNIPDQIDAEILDASGDNLKVVANFGVGYDRIDVDAATERNVIVTNTPHVITEATADITWLLILATARGAQAAERTLRAKEWTGWHPTTFIGKDLVDKTIFIVGMGNIGRAVARRALGWRMNILYNARSSKPDVETAPINANWRDLEDGLAEADVVTLNCPLTEETHHLMDARRIGLMKSSAILINTARGPIIDEEALVEALDSGRIHAAGFDVFEHEPKIHPRLLELENAILLPHLGSAGECARKRMTEMAVENLLAALSGEEVPNRVGN